MSPRVPYPSAGVRKSPSRYFTTPIRTRNHINLAPRHVKGKTKVTVPSSPPLITTALPCDEVPRAKVKQALKRLTESMDKVDADYAVVKSMLEQQARYVNTQQEALDRHESESAKLDDQLKNTNDLLRQIDMDIATLQPSKPSRAPSFRAKPHNRLQCTLRSLHRARSSSRGSFRESLMSA